MTHGTYDQFWQTKNNLPHFYNVTPAVMTVGGWFDSEDPYGHIHIYKSIEEKNPGIKNSIVVGPWIHGGWFRTKGDSLGDISFGSQTSKFYQDNILTPFFEYYLFGKGNLNLPEAYIFGTGINKWFQYDQWPPKNVSQKTLFLDADEKLRFENPKEMNTNSFDEYISDPNRPVPYSAKIHDSRLSYYKPYVIEDQRFASYRPDVLIYETDTLTTDVTIVGPLTADLFVSTSGTDSDWIVKLIDVFPCDSTGNIEDPQPVEWGNYQMLVRYGIMRGKFRNSLENPEPFIPNKVTEVKFEMNSVHHTFQKGHKIMIQIQSSFFPFFDRNPQKFVDIYNAKEEDFQKATQRVYFSEVYPSSIKFNVLK
jgi:putative CocE/NonD family hydrolase